MDKQPTEAQIKEFWEWCGFALDAEDFPMVPPVWEYPKGIFRKKLPPLDLNNLFKYAVPKVEQIVRITILIDWVSSWCYHQWGADPALALFWAIWENGG